ncbi:hypothetical protein QQ045_024633 [Rhodiola kirilowii]
MKPIVFTLVESKNTSWKWFIICIRDGVTSRESSFVICDRHGGEQPKWLPPTAYHRVCVTHLYSNFNTKVKDYTSKEKLGRVPYQRKANAMATWKYAHMDYVQFVAHEYTLEAYNMTWNYYFAPLFDEDFWKPYEGLPHEPNLDSTVKKSVEI